MKDEFKYQEKMRKKMKVDTKEELLSFLDEIADYGHDYGTVVRGLFVSMLATFNHMDKRMGGITGFQAGFLANLLLQEFSSLKPPYRILDFNNLLYPQYESKFDKTISMEAWQGLKEQARINLKESPNANQKVLEHWWKISKGVVPFGYKVVEE